MCNNVKSHEFICECGKHFDKIRQMTGHQSNCKIHQQKLHDEFEIRRLPNGKFKCENCGQEHDGSYASGRFCSKRYAQQWNAHQINLHRHYNNNCNKTRESLRAPYGTWKCNECYLIFDTRRLLQKHNADVHGNGHKRGKAWNKGLTKYTSKAIATGAAKISKVLRKAYEEGRLTGRCIDPVNEELRRKKISESMKNNPNAGGLRKGSGHGHKGRYHGYWRDSSWELAAVIYWLEHDISFERCNESFEYLFENNIHRYYPDFRLSSGEYVEIKGIEKSAQWKAKLEQFPKDNKLLVIGKDGIQKYLDYVEGKYGKDFITLYNEK